MGYRYRVVPIGYEGFVQPQKGQGEARLNQYYNNFVGMHIYQISYTFILDFLSVRINFVT